MTPTESDESLMAGFAAGDAAAFDRLYRRHEAAVWRYLLRSVNDAATADELMQDVWFGVARDASRYAPSAKFTTWLFTLAHNRLIDSYRKRRPRGTVDIDDLQAADGDGQVRARADTEPLARTLAGECMSAMIEALQRLPAEQCEAFLLQVEGDCSVEEIAAITGTSFETAKSRLRYARTKLRDLLREFA